MVSCLKKSNMQIFIVKKIHIVVVTVENWKSILLATFAPTVFRIMAFLDISASFQNIVLSAEILQIVAVFNMK